MALRPSLLALLLLTAACGTRYSPSFDASEDAVSDASARRDVASPSMDDGPVIAPDAAVDASAPHDAAIEAHAGHGAPYPIVLHHGFAGFQDIGPINYYYNVARDLRDRGHVVYESEVSPFLPPQDRGPELAAVVDRVLRETGSAKVVIIAHSQGGLDARYMISTMGYGDRVALLATVSTPHRGTRVADAIAGRVPGVSDGFIDAVLTVFGFAYNEAQQDAQLRRTLGGLSEAEATAFNENNPDDPDVAYWSWAGRSNRRDGAVQCAGGRFSNAAWMRDDVIAPLYPFALLLEQGDPDAHVNDGMVEVASAKWGEWMGCIPADHFDEVGQIARSGTNSAGWWHLQFYREMALQIRNAGF